MMSKDDSILILCLNLKTNKIYIIIWIQYIDNFLDKNFIRYYLSNFGYDIVPFNQYSKNNNPGKWSYTIDFDKALKFAVNMYMHTEQPEYGIKYVDTKIELSSLLKSIDSFDINRESGYITIDREFTNPGPSRLCDEQLQIMNLEEILYNKYNN